MEPDFTGWATVYNQKCSDGLTIKHDGFKHQDKQKVPLVWSHQHDSVENILGHALLENRAFGVYTQGFFNDSENGQIAKTMVAHGDVVALSIWANGLQKRKTDVLHGNIREVSLVLAGANPGALIDFVNLQHGAEDEFDNGEAEIYNGLALTHSALTEGAEVADTIEDLELDETQIQEVIDGLDPKQKLVFDYAVGTALETPTPETDEEKAAKAAAADELKQSQLKQHEEILEHINKTVKEGFDNMPNAFETNGAAVLAHSAVLSHDGINPRKYLSKDQMKDVIQHALKSDSLEDVMLAHAGDYGIDNIDFLFPDAKATSAQPELLARRVEWVDKVLGSVKKQPFAKIKSIVADLTGPEARARGYVKGNEKTEEVLALLRRSTSPATIYKKQKLDRDDIIDITDFDVVAWLKWEIRYMLDEEIARAILIGDGRSVSHEDKIKDPAGALSGEGIRSIANEHSLYAHVVDLDSNIDPEEVIDEVARSRRFYRGTGTPTFFTTDAAITDMLLLKDKMGRRLYSTEAELAAVLRVKEIVAVEVMEETPALLGIIVNLIDYTVGANKGGEISFFDDFDIDFNQNKYLMETRISGALTKPKSAIILKRALGTAATPVGPSFDGATNTITIPVTTGINYIIDGEVVLGEVEITEDTTVESEAKDGFYIPSGVNRNWNFAYTE